MLLESGPNPKWDQAAFSSLSTAPSSDTRFILALRTVDYVPIDYGYYISNA